MWVHFGVWRPKENNESRFQLPQCLEVNLPLSPVAIELGSDLSGARYQGSRRCGSCLCRLNEPHKDGVRAVMTEAVRVILPSAGFGFIGKL